MFSTHLSDAGSHEQELEMLYHSDRHILRLAVVYPRSS